MYRLLIVALVLGLSGCTNSLRNAELACKRGFIEVFEEDTYTSSIRVVCQKVERSNN